MKQTILHVEGMSCSHCEKAVQKALLTLDGVQEVRVNLSEKTVTVLAGEKVTEAAMKQVIENQGYDVV